MPWRSSVPHTQQYGARKAGAQLAKGEGTAAMGLGVFVYESLGVDEFDLGALK